MSTDVIIYRVAQAHEYDQVVRFITEYFFRDEPLCATEPRIMPSATDCDNIKEYIKEGTSILAVLIKANGEEELVGVNIGVHRDHTFIEKYLKYAAKQANAKYSQILKLIGVANSQADLFNRYGVNKLFYSFMSCVKPSCRGKNIGTHLKEELMVLAKQMGYKLIAVDCSSFYSASLCKRMGWDVANFIPYADYKDETGKPIFNPPPPHEGMTTLAVRL